MADVREPVRPEQFSPVQLSPAQLSIEQALQESEERYRRLVELAPDAIAVHREGHILYANPAAARLMGAAEPAELIGRSIFEFVHPDYRALVAARAHQVQDEGRPAEPLDE